MRGNSSAGRHPGKVCEAGLRENRIVRFKDRRCDRSQSASFQILLASFEEHVHIPTARTCDWLRFRMEQRVVDSRKLFANPRSITLKIHRKVKQRRVPPGARRCPSRWSESILERAHLRYVADLHAAELGLPRVKRRRADPVPTADLFGRLAGLVFFEDPDDLGFAEPRFLQDGLLRGRWPQDYPPISGILFRLHVTCRIDVVYFERAIAESRL